VSVVGPMTLSSALSSFLRFALPLALILPIGYAAAQDIVPSARIVHTVDNSQIVALKGNVHPSARAEFDQGLVPDDQPLKRMLLLLQRGPDQEAALRQLLEDQQSKANPNFHQWLTPEQFGARFGVADSDLLVISQWLTSQGFSDIHVGPGRTVIEFSGNVAQVRNAFRTQIRRFHVGTDDHFANSSDPQIPAALAPVISGVVSLHNFPRRSHLHKVGVFSRSRGTGKITPDFTTFGCSTGPCFAVGPADFAVIYNTKPLLNANPKIDGTGETIAIVGESDIDVQDIVDFRTMFGLPVNFSSQNIIVNGIDPGLNSSEGESDLDVEWAGAVAPGANILFVTSSPTETTAGIDLSALYIVEHNLAGVMSTSFGECEQALGSAENQFYNSLWEQAASQGITSLVSAGDGGSAGCDNFDSQATAKKGLAVSGLASTPFNIAVGGTDFDQDNRASTFWNTTNTPTSPLPVPASALSYVPEVPWNDSCAQLGASSCASAGNNSNIVAGSGGSSTLYAKPFWQMGITGMPTDTHRQLPDVSLFAGNGFHDSFYIMCQQDSTPVPTCNLSSLDTTFFGVGGTSVSSPALAGIMALVNQKTGSRQGNANVTFYALSKQTGASCAANGATLPAATCTFNDVAKSNNSVPCTGKSPNCSSTVATAVGVLVDPSNSAPAYNAAAGYDRATGLGSINAANLVNNWSSVSTQATTTSLTVNSGGASTIAHGSSVPVSITVAPTTGSGTPTGDVALIATFSNGNTFGLGEFKLGAGGTVSASTTSLVGGSYKISARYTGDGTFAPGNSAPQNLVINPETSKVLISIPVFNPQTGQETGNAPTSLVYGSPYIARMDIGNSSAALTFPPSHSCTPPACPTGSVALSDSLNATPPTPLDGGTFPLNSFGFTEDFAIQLTGGQHVLAANYSGDSSFNSATGTYSISVTPAATRLIPSNPPFPSTVATPFALSVILTMNVFGAMPACDFTFTDGTAVLQGTPICAWQANGPFLYVSLPISQATAGQHTYSAKFNGDTNYSPSSAASLPTRVFFGTTTTLAADSTNIQFGTNITLTAIVDSTVLQGPPIGQLVTFLFNNIPVTGNLTFTPFTDSSGNIALRATLTTQPQSSGFYTVNFAGDSTYNPSAAFIDVTVNIPDFNLSANLSGSAITAGASATATVTAAPTSNLPSPVTLSCPVVGNPAGISCSFSPATLNLNGGNPSSSTLTIVTLAPSSTNTISSLPLEIPRIYASPVSWRIFLIATVLMVFLLLLFRTARPRHNAFASAAATAVLSCLLLYFYGCGGGSTGGGGGGPVPSSITLTATSVKVPLGSSVNVTANVTSSKVPGGTVTLTFDGSAGFSLTSPVVGGVAQFPITGQGVGVHTIRAKYSGDTNTLGSQTAGALNVAVTGPTGVQFSGTTGGLAHIGGVNFNLQ
jgi:Pro-kumamolisin, activation domain/Bacterial Ig-like domain (group 3)